jgi:putative phosphoesterase
MKIGVISDTHLSRYHQGLADAIDRHFKDVDLVLHAGDVVDVQALEVFAGRKVLLVAGNMDSPSIRDAAPVKRLIPAGTFTLGLIHGWGAPEGIEDRIINEFDTVDAIVYGHTHRASSGIRNGVLFFNPGSATDNRHAPFTSVGILEIGDVITPSIIRL